MRESVSKRARRGGRDESNGRWEKEEREIHSEI